MTSTDTTRDSDSHYEWEGCDCPFRETARLHALTEEGAFIHFHLDWRDCEVLPAFVVETADRRSYCTDSPADWPGVEQYVPRDEWPEEMNAGRRGPAGRRPDPAIAAEIDELRARIAQWEREEEEAHED